MKIFEVLLNEKAYLVEVSKIGPDGAMVTVNGTPYEVGINDITRTQSPTAPRSDLPEMSAAAAPADAKPQAAQAAAAGMTTVKAPLPGLILEVTVSVGDKVSVGDTIIVIETMKMENAIIAPVAGTVKEINIADGQNVAEGAPLIVISV